MNFITYWPSANTHIPRCLAQEGVCVYLFLTTDKDLTSIITQDKVREWDAGSGRRRSPGAGRSGSTEESTGLCSVWSVGSLWRGVLFCFFLLFSPFSRETMTELSVGVFVLDILISFFFFFFFHPFKLLWLNMPTASCHFLEASLFVAKWHHRELQDKKWRWGSILGFWGMEEGVERKKKNTGTDAGIESSPHKQPSYSKHLSSIPRLMPHPLDSSLPNQTIECFPSGANEQTA